MIDWIKAHLCKIVVVILVVVVIYLVFVQQCDCPAPEADTTEQVEDGG